MKEINGLAKLGRIEEDLQGMKDDMGEMKDSLVAAITSLTEAVNSLSVEVRAFLNMKADSVPIKMVFLMFAIIFTVVVGIEGVRTLLDKIKTIPNLGEVIREIASIGGLLG